MRGILRTARHHSHAGPAKDSGHPGHLVAMQVKSACE